MSSQHTVLAIDTSTATMAAAIVRGEEVLASIQSQAERNHSLHIMTNVEKLLKEANISLSDITGFVAGIGPGSYTGVRIAVTAAKTLAWTKSLPVVGVSSLEALAYGACLHQSILPSGMKKTYYIPIMDARRGQVYTSAFAFDDAGQWRRTAEDGIRLMSEWVDEWIDLFQNTTSEAEVWIVGDGAQHSSEIQRLKLSLGNIEVKEIPFEMDGQALGQLGLQQLNTQRNLTSAHDIVPNYTQKTEAEVKLEGKQKGETPS